MDAPEYTRLKITGDISVENVTYELPEDALVYLLWGPTGAGKGCFIQALAGDSQDLGISKDQLAGFTQRASVYKLVNVMLQLGGALRPIYLVDTPGFSDPNISHRRVIKAGSELFNEIIIKEGNHVKVLFLTPVTDTRIPGTKRRTIEMLTAVYEPSKYSLPLTIVTTMWNTLYRECAHHRAEKNYAQLRDEIWKAWLSILIPCLIQLINFEQGFSDMGATTARFTNTRESALKILDTGPWKGGSYLNAVAMRTFLYGDLHERIETALQQKQIITSELTHPQAQTNPELKAILHKNHRENEEMLKKFVKEFLDIGFPPAGYEDAHHHLLQSLLGTYIPRTIPIRRFVLRCQLTRLVRHSKQRGAKLFKHKV